MIQFLGVYNLSRKVGYPDKVTSQTKCKRWQINIKWPKPRLSRQEGKVWSSEPLGKLIRIAAWEPHSGSTPWDPGSCILVSSPGGSYVHAVSEAQV